MGLIFMALIFDFTICDQGDGYNNYDISVKAEKLPATLEKCVPSWWNEDFDDLIPSLKEKNEKRTSSEADMDAAKLMSIIAKYPAELDEAQTGALGELLSKASGPIKTFTYDRYYETSNKEYKHKIIKAEIDGHLLTYSHHLVVRD
eukprot:gnl/TRDRNA2_/TRDRNA2_128657_c0_seq4.p1 gnl/TRDRNA2_/TRDRNA2_128657_c0~~gnl/TRDRNA2_/TRDRNA2_128657_c0_seq4.p1  ORF type:complete len:146 (-),score=24.53 gnl/TRDRNA2_/TRDRNA2_128657_c0_seq4:117-554(-)